MRLFTKLLNDCCLECFTCAMFLCSSLMASIMVRFMRSLLFTRIAGFYNGASFQLNESVVRHRFRKQMAHIFAHILKIEMLQATVPWVMKQDENGHYFGIRHHAIAMILAFLGIIESRYGILLKSFIKNFAEIVTNWENFYNFVTPNIGRCVMVLLAFLFIWRRTIIYR